MNRGYVVASLDETPPFEFSPGNVVTLVANPSVGGAVIQVLPGSLENRYVVLQGFQKVTYYASQLMLLQEKASKHEVVELPKFHAFITALQLIDPSIASLYSLHASRVDHIPYQFRPVLKFIRSDRPRLLIADEVGVGKTIEAGLVMRELQARTEVQSVLIICPKPLVVERKWQQEMKRFDEQFMHLDGAMIKHCIQETDLDGEWPVQYAKAILPFSLFNERLLYGGLKGGHGKILGLLDLDPPPRFDLIIVDEAHHLRNSDTYVHQGASFLCEHAEAVVFLTATPVQLGNGDLYTLLNLLRPDLIIDPQSFEHMSEPNPFINQAVESARAARPGWPDVASQALLKATDTAWGRSMLQRDPEFMRLRTSLQGGELSPKERVSFIHDAEQLHTFSGLINRTRRRDIGKFTTRKPETVAVAFTPEQQQLHDDLLDTQTAILRRLHGDQNIKFMMTTIRRQAASCLFGLAPLLRDILTRRIDELELVEVDEGYEEFSNASVSSIRTQIEKIIAQAETLNSNDPKLEAMFNVVSEKQAMLNNKVLVFTSFRHTLRYLYKNCLDWGLRVGMIHGGVQDEERRSLRKRFSLKKDAPEALDVLLSSEVGCEGLDFQFCDCLVNYDLPWNPMRVEQRIGRIDRYGQKSEAVAIYNLITPGTVDADIYERCLWRIGVFQESVGGNEEILGRIAQELKAVAENFELSRDERASRLQQLADNEIRLIREQSMLEEQQAELFGIRVPAKQEDREVAEASNYWLSPEAVRNLVDCYLKVRCGADQTYILGEKEPKTLRLNQDARNLLLEDFKKLPRQNAAIWRDWEKWLKGSEPTLRITFDAATAAEYHDARFIMPVHPLSQQAAQDQVTRETVYTMCKVVDSDAPSGAYPFAIYQWKKKGVREDAVLQPVCTNPIIGDSFLALLERAELVEDNQYNLPEQIVFDQLDAEHHRLWTQHRQEHKEYTEKLAFYRVESLKTSHQARLALLNEQLGKTSEGNIQRMRRAQISKAEADYQRRKEELEKLARSADVTAQAVAFGLLVVELS
jgi:ERCC4-related helicase